MAHKYLELIKKGASNPAEARILHLQVLPLIQKELDNDQRLLDELQRYGRPTASEVIEIVQKNNFETATVIAAFSAKWPAPEVTLLPDTIKPEPECSLQKIALSQSLPLIPLTCLNDNISRSPLLFYRDEATGALFKVPNMSYNRPNTRKKITWSF